MMSTKFRAPIIAIYGPIRSGKTTTAEYLVTTNRFQRIAFADALRHEITQMLISQGLVVDDYPTTYKRLMDPATKERYRPLLQWWGEFRRKENGADYWLHKLIEAATDASESGMPIVIDDCRYQNEYLLLKRHGARFFRLTAQVHTLSTVYTDPPHPSEADWPDFTPDQIIPWLPVEERTSLILAHLRKLDLYYT